MVAIRIRKGKKKEEQRREKRDWGRTKENEKNEKNAMVGFIPTFHLSPLFFS